MKSKNILLTFATMLMLLFTACNSEAQTKNQTTKSSVSTKIEIIQLH